MRKRVTRNSDGKTIDLDKSQAEEYNETALAEKGVLIGYTGSAYVELKLEVDGTISVS